MGRHRAPDPFPDRLERDTRNLLKGRYTGRHLDVDRQPGRATDGVPDSHFDPADTRGPNDPDRWDR
jgi:hypothetical protein